MSWLKKTIYKAIFLLKFTCQMKIICWLSFYSQIIVSIVLPQNDTKLITYFSVVFKYMVTILLRQNSPKLSFFSTNIQHCTYFLSINFLAKIYIFAKFPVLYIFLWLLSMGSKKKKKNPRSKEAAPVITELLWLKSTDNLLVFPGKWAGSQTSQPKLVPNLVLDDISQGLEWKMRHWPC